MSQAVISGQAVINYLRSRNSFVDFIRDTMDVYLENEKVVVKLTDKVSGGSSTHVSLVDVATFEKTYGA